MNLRIFDYDDVKSIVLSLGLIQRQSLVLTVLKIGHVLPES